MEINVLRSAGLQTDPNPLSSVEPGALVSGKNFAYDRVNVYEKARGYNPFVTLSGAVKKFFEFQNTTLAYYLKNGIDQTLAYEAGSSFTDYGTYPCTYPMFSTSANNNFYFTTDDGVKKLDSVTGTPTYSGVPQGLGGSYTLIASTGNVLQTGYKTAYRIIWGYTDLNDNLILGAPSPRIPVENTSGSTQDVELTFQIPDAITTTNFFYQIYRAEEVLVATIPLDEMYLVDQVNLTAAQIVSGFVTFADHVEVDDLGATIYTAPSQQGIQNSYYQPPFCKDIGWFEGTVFYSNTRTKQIILLTMTKVLSTGFGYFSVTGDITTASYLITNASDTSNIQIGQLITGTGIQPDTFVLGKTLTTITISLPAIATTVGVALTLRDFIQIDTEYYFASDTNDPANRYFNVNTDIENATINFTNLVNDISASFNAYYLGIGDIDKGAFEIEALTFGQSAFVVNSSQPTAFIATLPQTSTNEEFGNRMYLSLPDQPESVPFGNYVDIGTKEYHIERTLFLRDSFYIFKSDGSVYKGVGSTIDSISIRLFDSNAKLRGIQLPAILDNNIFCFSDQGVIVVNDNGIQVISYPIERDLFKISKTRNTSFETVSFGIGYETDRKYIMFCSTEATDTVATQAYVFNILTKGWARLERDVSFGFWNRSQDRLYVATDVVAKERKEYNETDFSNSEVALTVTNVSGLEITVASSVGVSVGWSLYQDIIGGTTKAKITDINGNVLTVSELKPFIVGAAKGYEPYDFSFTYAPQTYGNFPNNKFHKELTHYVENVTFENFTQSITNEDQDTVSTDVLTPKTSAIPLQFLRTYIPMQQSRSNWLNLTIEQNEACTNLEYLGYTLTGDIISERSK
jgi:hypothetical protein